MMLIVVAELHALFYTLSTLLIGVIVRYVVLSKISFVHISVMKNRKLSDFLQYHFAFVAVLVLSS